MDRDVDTHCDCNGRSAKGDRIARQRCDRFGTRPPDQRVWWQLTLRERLRRRRTDLGWDQTRLAVEIGTDRSTISDIESGKTHSPRVDTILHMAAAMGLYACQLFHALPDSPPVSKAEVR